MPDPLGDVLERAQALGFLGPADPEAHRGHALAMADATERALGRAPGHACDLGAGGGIPGLVLASRWPDTTVVLLEAAARRCGFLRDAVATLGLGPRVAVAEGRAEILARDPRYDEGFEAVTARGFGPPAVTAECAARLLAHGAVLVVAEPPASAAPGARWPADGLAQLGLGPAAPVGHDPAFVAIRRVAACPDRYPRRVGIPAKRPLF